MYNFFFFICQAFKWLVRTLPKKIIISLPWLPVTSITKGFQSQALIRRVRKSTKLYVDFDSESFYFQTDGGHANEYGSSAKRLKVEMTQGLQPRLWSNDFTAYLMLPILCLCAYLLLQFK